MLSITQNPIRISLNKQRAFNLIKTSVFSNVSYPVAKKPNKTKNMHWWQREEFIYMLRILVPYLILISYHFFFLNQKPQEFFLIVAFLSVLFVGLGLFSEWTLLISCFLASLPLPSYQQSILFSGFTNQGIYIISTMLLATAVIQKSNVLSRMILLLLIKISKKEALLDRAIFFIGILLTPLVSSQSARVAIISSILDNIMMNNKVKPQSITANSLANAGFFGCILLSSVFLSGKSSNYLLLTIMCHQGGHNGWFTWLSFASFPGILLIGAFFLMQSRAFKHKQSSQLRRFTLLRSYATLGSLSKNEKQTILYTIFLIAGLICSPFLNINLLLLDVLFVLIALKIDLIQLKQLHRMVNWSCLIYLATIIGLMNFLSHIELIQWNMALKESLTLLMSNSFSCIGFVFIISWFLGFIFGTMITPGLVLTVLYPLLIELHINLWIIGFVILIATESWIFPYQSSYFICFKKLTAINKNFTLKPILRINGYFVLIKVLILFASIPFWKILKLI